MVGSGCRSPSSTTADAGSSAVEPSGAEAPGGEVDIFVEGFDAAYFRAPRREGAAYLLPIDGLSNPAALVGARLKLTVVSQSASLEQVIAVE